MRLVLTALLGVALAAIAQVAVPPVARVTDQTGTLGAEQKAALERMLEAFEARKGSQIAVLMVPTTGGEPVEQFALRVAEQWKLGRKGVDDGEPLPAPARSAPQVDGGVFQFLPIVLIAAMVVGGVLRAILGRGVGALATGGAVGFLAWILAGTLFVGVIAGVLALLFTLVGGGFGGGRRYGGFPGGFPGGIGRGGSWGGGGGGFRGGGGGFGGGGASGRW